MPISGKSSICNFMMENSHQECRIGDLLLLNFSTVESLNNGHFGTNINSSGLSLCIEVVLFKRFQSHYIDRGIKFGNLVSSIVERYLIQYPFLGVSVKRDSTVN